MDELGWQTLLAAELAPFKIAAVLADALRWPEQASAIIQDHPLLSEEERKRAKNPYPRAFEKAMAAGVRIADRRSFPAWMGEAPISPAIFYWGDFSAAAAPTVGIVGTRGASTYGKAVAIKFAEALAGMGVTIVSGGALGIDAAAHRGALSVGGKTIAVLAGGIEQVYPSAHAGLFESIKQNGCLVSHHAIGSRPNPYKFLSRNHLIAALSQAVLVVEAPERSGSLSTVHAALEQNKQVLVVPANIDQLSFAGSHALIRDGATLVYHPDQVCEALGLERKKAKEPAKPELSTMGKKIVAALKDGPLSGEMIVDRTVCETSDVMSELTLLELDGHIMRDGGKYAVRF